MFLEKTLNRKWLYDQIRKNIFAFLDDVDILLCDFQDDKVNFDKRYTKDIFQKLCSRWDDISTGSRKNCVDTIVSWNLNNNFNSLIDIDEYDKLKDSSAYNMLLHKFDRITYIVFHFTKLLQILPYSIRHLNKIENISTDAFQAFWKARKFMHKPSLTLNWLKAGEADLEYVDIFKQFI